jgi:hypothetical protein
MGAGQSVAKELSRQGVYEATKSTRNVMNILLEYMLKEISVRDFYLLSNPNECKKYVLFLANNMYKHFYELGISPTKDKKGIIAFRSVKDLAGASSTASETEKLEHQSLCVILSYFYTRIFQILGALSLTLIDDAAVMADKGLILDESGRQRLYAPGFRPYVTRGGAPNRDIGVFSFLKNYLIMDEDTYSPEYGWRSKSPSYIVFFKRGSSSDVFSLSYNGTFTVGFRGSKQVFYLDISAKSETIDNSDILVTLKKLRFIKKGSSVQTTVDVPSAIVDAKTFHVILSRRKVDEKKSNGRIEEKIITEYSIRDSQQSISEYFESLFSKLEPYVKSMIEGDTTYLSDIKEGTTHVDEREVIEQLRLQRTIHNLTKEKPLAHCLARALQLLRTAPIDKVDGESNICKARFLQVKDGYSRSGVPLPGATLDTSPGLTALSQLFYDTVQYGLPKVSIGAGPTLQKYTEFMKIMAVVFGDYTKDGAVRTEGDLTDRGLKGIHNKRDRDLCGTTSEIRVPTKEVPAVYSIVKELYKQQIEHSARAGSIFKMLFNIQSDKSGSQFKVSFNDNILKKGIPEINRINSIARDVLVNYYKNCELTYMKGMKTVLDATRPRPVITNPNPITPTTAPIATAPPVTPRAMPKIAPGAKAVPIDLATIRKK